MEKILVGDSMSVAAGKINAAFAALSAPLTLAVIDGDDDMSTIATKVNGNFALLTSTTMAEIDNDDTMSQIATKMKHNFDLLEPEYEERSRSISFVHASDPHGRSEFIEAFESYIQNHADFALITGDLKPYNTTVGLESYYNISNDSGSLKKLKESGKLLVTSGNHDSNDSWASGQTVHTNSRMKTWMFGLLGESVNWGDRADDLVNEPNLSDYYYRDFQKGRNVLRVIVIDQYEFDAVAGHTNGLPSNPTCVYAPVYTSSQFNWLINLLKTTPSSYHIIIALHQSPLSDNVYGDSVRPEPDVASGSTYFNTPTSLLFASEKVSELPYNQYVPDAYNTAFWAEWNNPILDIVKAYLEAAHLIRTFRNVNTDTQITIDADFTSIVPAHFCGYICGHLHFDLATWLPFAYDEHYTQTYGSGGIYQRNLYPKQLSLGITAADKVVGQQTCDDLDDSTVTTTYRINKITIVFATEDTVPQVIVERIGTKITDGGRNRDKIRFWINAEQTVDIPAS